MPLTRVSSVSLTCVRENAIAPPLISVPNELGIEGQGGTARVERTQEVFEMPEAHFQDLMTLLQEHQEDMEEDRRYEEQAVANAAEHQAFGVARNERARIFDEALRTGLLLHPDSMRLIAANLDRIVRSVRA